MATCMCTDALVRRVAEFARIRTIWCESEFLRIQLHTNRASSRVDEFQRRPARRVFWVRKRRPGSESLQTQLAIIDGIGEANLAMLVGVVAAERVGRHECGEPIAAFDGLRGHL